MCLRVLALFSYASFILRPFPSSGKDGSPKFQDYILPAWPPCGKSVPLSKSFQKNLELVDSGWIGLGMNPSLGGMPSPAAGLEPAFSSQPPTPCHMDWE